MGVWFYPRGGSAHSARALARQLGSDGVAVTLLSGSRTDLGPAADAGAFYEGLDVRPVDFTPALRSPRPQGEGGGPGTAPIHGSYEDRPGAEDAVLASLDDEAFERHVEAWTAELETATAEACPDLLYLHHLTPLNEAAARALPGVPIVGHVHGTELLMLEAIEADAGWPHGEVWAERLRRWAAACARIVVNDPRGRERAARLLELEPERFAVIPNGFEPSFSPAPVDRRAVWRRTLVEEPRGWRPGEEAGSVAYSEAELAPLEGTVCVYVGRFTAVKRLPLLIEAFAAARERGGRPAALVLVGGHPAEWEGEHPAETIARLGAEGVFLAGWHSHAELPQLLRAADLLVHASPREQFGQSLVEAMACGIPVVAVDRGGPASIVDDPETGWLVEPEDAEALAAAISEAIADPDERRRRGRRSRAEASANYSWQHVGRQIEAVLREAAPVGQPRG